MAAATAAHRGGPGAASGGVLANLLANALRHTPAGGRVPGRGWPTAARGWQRLTVTRHRPGHPRRPAAARLRTLRARARARTAPGWAWPSRATSWPRTAAPSAPRHRGRGGGTAWPSWSCPAGAGPSARLDGQAGSPAPLPGRCRGDRPALERLDARQQVGRHPGHPFGHQVVPSPAPWSRPRSGARARAGRPRTPPGTRARTPTATPTTRGTRRRSAPRRTPAPGTRCAPPRSRT